MYANWLKQADCKSVGVERPHWEFESLHAHRIKMKVYAYLFSLCKGKRKQWGVKVVRIRQRDCKSRL